jgi:hypothetical protein
MTAIKINTYPANDLDAFNDDNTPGIYRIGRTLIRNRGVVRNIDPPARPFPVSDSIITELNIDGITSLTSNFESGIRGQFTDDDSEALMSFVKEGDTSTKQIKLDFGKVKQGVSIKSTFDLHADFLPYVYIQGGKSPYPNNIHQRFNPTFDEDLFGVKEQLNRTSFIPYEDISVVSPGYVSAKNYLQNNNPYANKIYPRFSGSHYANPYQLVGKIEPLELTRTRHEVKLIDQVSVYTARRHVFGISANLMISEREEAGFGKPFSVKKGGTFIVDRREIRYDTSKTVERFDDSKSIIRFNNTIDDTIGTTESTGIFDFIPFDDVFDVLSDTTSYSFLTNKPSQYQSLTGSINTMSEIGSRYISANAGYIYESTTLGNTTLGTDSIAFGGLNRRG